MATPPRAKLSREEPDAGNLHVRGVNFPEAPYATPVCKRNIEMTPLCQLEMTLTAGFPGQNSPTANVFVACMTKSLLPDACAARCCVCAVA